MRIKINFFSVMLALSLFITEGWEILFIIFPAILHELGHLIAAKACKVGIREMSVTILGARISLDGYYSYFDEFIISLCGPLVNIICVILTAIYLRYSKMSNISYLFFSSSLSLALTNLMPIKSFDGGRMLQSILLKKFQISYANIIISATSFVTLFSLWSVSVYFLLRFNTSLSLFIFSISLFSNIFITKSV